MKNIDEYGLFNLTPIEEYNGMLFKREDLFQPFSDIPINGAKARQCFCLLYNKRDELKLIKSALQIATTTSVHSAQGLIVTRVAKEFGYKTLVGIGATFPNRAIEKYPLMRKTNELGGFIMRLAGVGYSHVLYQKLSEMRRTMAGGEGEDFFIVQFGMNAQKTPELVLEPTANQVRNLPTDLDNLVIPVGSGVTMAGILHGLIKYHRKPKRIIGIQIAGIDRDKYIHNLLPFKQMMNDLPFRQRVFIKYEFYRDTTYPYAKRINVNITNGFTLDPIYEAKAYLYMKQVLGIPKEEKTLFWVIGNTGVL